MGAWLSFGMQYHWCCVFDSLVAKDCQYPRDPMQPAIKKKKKGPDKPGRVGEQMEGRWWKGSKAGPATMTSRATEKEVGGGAVW